MNPITLAEVVLEVAAYYPDTDDNIPRAMWRWDIVEKAIKIVNECNITGDTDDIDEVVQNYLCNEEALS